MVITPNKADHLLATVELGGGNFAKLSAFPGYFRWEERSVIFRATGANIDHVIRHWPEAQWIGGAEAFRDARNAQTLAALQVSEEKRSEPILDESGYAFHRQPMAHQLKAFMLSRDKKAFALFMEQGTGKTKVIIDTACYLYQKGEIDMLIIIAWPNGVHSNWIEYELPADMSVPYAATDWTPNHRAKFRQVEFAKVMLARDKLRVFAFNVEAFTSEDSQDFIVELLEANRAMLVIDQSASIANPQAKRTKFLINKCSELAPYRRILDGQPVAEGASELFSQFKFLDPWIIGHDTWTAFRAEFCIIGRFNEVQGYRNLPELHQRIDGHCYRVLADDCLDLPERTYKKWQFSLSDKEHRIFNEMRSLSWSSFTRPIGELTDLEIEELPEAERIQEALALVKNMRLQQISSGWWPGDEFKAINGEGEVPARAKALLTLLDAAEGKALIFSRFRPDLELIQRMLGDKAVSYHGGISGPDRAEAKRRFMLDEKVLYFIGQPRTAGIGHTLTAARHVIFYANHDSLRLREECEKRAHRKGLKHNLIVWDMMAKGTHDAKVVRALRAKKSLANVILQDPENFFLQHEK